MVVMLILTIVLAAFAPLMTKRRTVDLSSPWRYATNNSDIYYGLGEKQTAMIGQNSKSSSDSDSRLLIKTAENTQNHILLKSPEQDALVRLASDSILIGSGYKNLNLSNNGQVSALGAGALENLTTGIRNTAIGASALLGLSETSLTGNSNTAVGANALKYNSSGSSNVAAGESALTKNTTGQYNVAIGNNALMNNILGEGNTAVGYMTGFYTSGDNNTMVGHKACINVYGSNKTCIGANSGPESFNYGNDEIIYLGTKDSTVYIPGNLIVGKQSFLGPSLSAKSAVWMRAWQESGWLAVDVHADTRHTLHFTNVDSGSDVPHGGKYPDWVGNIISDRRLKNVGKLSSDGLEKIRQLKVYNYTLKNDKKITPRVGVIAQDLKKVFPHAVVKGSDGYLRIRQEDMFYAVINAIKQLDGDYQRLQKENQELKARLDKIEKVIDELK